MSYQKLPNRVFNGPCIEFVNFEDGSHVNLIRLIKPYANGIAYAIHETTRSPFCSNGLFKSLAQAKIKFDLMVKNGADFSPISNSGKTNNARIKQ